MPLIAISASIIADSSIAAGATLPRPGYGTGSYGGGPYGSILGTALDASIGADSVFSATLINKIQIAASLIANSAFAGVNASIVQDASAILGDSTCDGYLSGGTPVTVQRFGNFGTGDLGIGPYGGASPLLQVEGATSLSLTSVSVAFTDLLDFTFLPALVPGNYSISPPLTILGVVPQSAKSVILLTTTQANISYTVTVQAAKSLSLNFLDLTHNQATFTGSLQSPTFFGVATGPTRVRAVFAQPMLLDVNLTNPANYTVQDIDGTNLPVLSATSEQATNPTSVLLTLGVALTTQTFYDLTLAASIQTNGGQSVEPPTSVFQWVSSLGQVSIPEGAFSGEVLNGLFGIHNGLVFFSPALVNSAANSIIQVDEVDVCTKAYDEYHFPQPVDPPPFFTHGGGLYPTPPSFLNSPSVLWVDFPLLFEAKLELGFHPNDIMPQAVDGAVSVTFQEPWTPSRVALLNNTAWYLFNNTGLTVPPTFITADNLTPIPPGPTSILILHAPMDGGSSFAGTPTAAWAGAAQFQANSTMIGVPIPDVPILTGPVGNANVTAAATVTYHPTLPMLADSFVSATLSKFP